MRLANHSPAVAPPVWSFAFSGSLTASATILLKFAIGSSTTAFPGRVKNTRDHRVCLRWSPGGWLSINRGVSGFVRVQGNLGLHDTVEVRFKYPSAEDRHCVPC